MKTFCTIMGSLLEAFNLCIHYKDKTHERSVNISHWNKNLKIKIKSIENSTRECFWLEIIRGNNRSHFFQVLMNVWGWVWHFQQFSQYLNYYYNVNWSENWQLYLLYSFKKGWMNEVFSYLLMYLRSEGKNY